MGNNLQPAEKSLDALLDKIVKAKSKRALDDLRDKKDEAIKKAADEIKKEIADKQHRPKD